MDEDLKLVERLKSWADHKLLSGNLEIPPTICATAAATITRLYACRTADQDTIDALMAQNAEFRDKLDSVGLSEAELERCCKDLDLQIAGLVKERDEALATVARLQGAWSEVDRLSAVNSAITTRAETAEAQRDEARAALAFLLDRLTDYENSDEAGREFHGHVAPAAARARSASRTLGGVGE